jgi:glycosyltransferase involved in cell wall biosynthesis
MITPGLVSVVIPCYNAAPYVAVTIDSALDQQGVNVEIIVVDDGSSDGSGDVVASRFPGVLLYRTDNRGPSAARNYGTERCNGEFIQYLDADDLLAPRKLETQMRALRQSNGEVAYGDWLKFRLLPDGTRIVEERFERQLGRSPDIDLFTRFWCPPAAYLIRRSAVDRVGGWHPCLPVIQDARFMLDCALNGSQFVYCAGLMAEYRVHRRDSVSTRSRAAFLADCLQNALEVQNWWASHGQLDDNHRKAVIEVLDMVANGSIAMDAELFDRSCRAIGLLVGQYPRGWPLKKRLAVNIFGYRYSMTAAHYLRRSKAAVSRRLRHHED